MKTLKIPPANCPLCCFLRCLHAGGRLLVGEGRAAVECPDGLWAEVGPDILDEAESGRLIDLSGERVRLTRRGRELAQAWGRKWHKPRRKGRVV